MKSASLILAFAAVSALALGTLCGSDGAQLSATLKKSPKMAIPVNLRVAFLGDAGTGSNQRSVLNMVKDWGAEAVFHAGDFEYQDNPALFESNLNDVLGPDFPYFASVGNHDINTWSGSSGHQARLVSRMNRCCPNACQGEYGVNADCVYQGLHFVMSAPGETGSNHATFIENTFADADSVWRFTMWHKNQKQYQIGSKSNEVGYAVYDASRRSGAFIHTGHEHSFCRSYIMSDFADYQVANFNDTLNVRPGETFVWVSGLAGNSIRSWDSSLVSNEWWAAVGASNNNIRYGAMLCTFNVNGQENRADCEFRDTTGAKFDEFTMYSHNPTMPQQKATCKFPFFEIPVVSNRHNAVVDLKSKIAACDLPNLPLGGSSAENVVALKFENIPLNRGAKIETSHLQVFGSKNDESVAPNLKLHIFHVPASFEFSCGNIENLNWLDLNTPAAAEWIEDDEGFTLGEGWVSPSLVERMQEIVNKDNWQFGDSVVVVVSGASNLEIASYEYNRCVAPAITIELEKMC